MNDAIGIIGQKYEDRKSKKTGLLVKREEESKKLHFLDAEGNPFSISYAAFKSNWRKVITEAPVEEVADTPEVEAETTTEPWSTEDFSTEDDKIKDFVKALTEVRVASVDVTPTNCSVMADDVIICTMEKVVNGYKIFMLPDIFTYTDWHNTFKVGDVHFNIKHGRHTGISIDCVKADIGDILQFIKTAAVEINLYGYID